MSHSPPETQRSSLYGVELGEGGGGGRVSHGQALHLPRAASRAPPPTVAEHAHHFSLAEHPQFLLTTANDPFANIKVRKRVTIWPLTLTARADYNRCLRAIQYGFTCKDNVLRGTVSLDLPTQRVQYRNLLPVGNGAFIAITASCSVPGLATGGHAGAISPAIGFQWFFGSGGGMMLGRDNKIDLQRRIRVSRVVSLEACGTLEFPMPTAQYALRDSTSQFSFGGPDPDSKFHAHLDQLNMVLNL